ncbi:MAG: alpha-L-fucosidase [Opitutaceae bacterium]|jgi:alpha-L-fucosidase|nr:alpha-L-fucosidase [Opitutaceae bacterium]
MQLSRTLPPARTLTSTRALTPTRPPASTRAFAPARTLTSVSARTLTPASAYTLAPAPARSLAPALCLISLLAFPALPFSAAPLSNVPAIPAAPAPLGPLPSDDQMSWFEDELTMFVHFGMNTFTGLGTGHGDENPNLFAPARLDCNQWVRVAGESGFKGIIITAKHHDGFCIWPTDTTAHSVKKSSWRGGKGDVMRELADACHAGGMKLGVYCSPWDRSQVNYTGDKPAYARLYRRQLTELLTNYGPVYEMWLDGNKADVDDWPNVINLIRRLQPRAVIKQGPRLPEIREDLRWVGNELAAAPVNNWNVYPAPDGSPPPTPRDSRPPAGAAPIFFPAECDTMMIGQWFWNDTPPRDLATLLNFYYVSIGRGSILLLNIAPDRDGLISDDTVARLREFRAALNSIFDTDLAAGKPATASNIRGAAVSDAYYGPQNALDNRPGTYWTTDDGITRASLEVDLGAPATFNVIRLEENLRLGQRVSAYQVEAWDTSANDWRVISAGKTIGHRKLDRIRKTTATKVRLTILDARACPVLTRFGLHLDTVSPAEHFAPGFASAEAAPGARLPPLKK